MSALQFDTLEQVLEHLKTVRNVLLVESEHQSAVTAVPGNPYIGMLNARASGLNEAIECITLYVLNNYDPTPWCAGCGAMTRSKCDCGPLADND